MAALVAWHRHFGFREFGGMDGGVLLNVAWQEYLGRVPYRDFLTAVPPIHLIPCGLAFRWLGPSWDSLVWLTAFFSAGSYLACVGLGRWCGLRFDSASWMALAVQALTLGTLSWWWYNQVTSILAVIYLLGCYALARAPQSRLRQLALAAAIGLFLLAKVNIAATLFVGCSAWLLCQAGLRKSYFVSLAGGTAFALLLLGLSRINPLDVASSYFSASGRVSKSELHLLFNFENDTQAATMAFLFFTGFTAHTCWRFRDSLATPSPLRLAMGFCALGLLVYPVGCLTNRDLKLDELAPGLAGMFLLVSALPGRRRDIALRDYQRWFFWIFAGFLIFDSAVIGIKRQRIYMIGAHSFTDLAGAKIKIQKGLFQGMTVSPPLVETRKELQAFITREGGPAAMKGRLFIGPRLDFAYADEGIVPIAGLPLWWEGTSPDSPAARQLFDQAEYMIFFRKEDGLRDTPFMPQGLLDRIDASYSNCFTGKRLLAFRRIHAAPSR